MIPLRDKLRTGKGPAACRLRKQAVEPIFGTIKQAMGFRQFLLRGMEKVSGEWEQDNPTQFPYDRKEIVSQPGPGMSQQGSRG